MKPNVWSILLLTAAIMAIVALCIPIAAGSYESVPPGSSVACVFYWNGFYSYLRTGDAYARYSSGDGIAQLGALSTFLVIAGAAYVIITLLPRLKAGKTAFLGGIFILLGTVFPLILGIFDVEREVIPWNDIRIGEFARVNVLPIILGFAAGGLAIVGGIMTWLNIRKSPN
jgi:hypothetical protein